MPFDLTEGESELVSGFNVEYRSFLFAMFFLAEYIHILLMSVLGSVLFLGGSFLFVKGELLDSQVCFPRWDFANPLKPHWCIIGPVKPLGSTNQN